MKYTLNKYINKIKSLPIKDKYTKEEILTQDFIIDKDNTLEIYYTPHNEYINPNAKIFIVGITPGFQQMSTAMTTARKGIEDGKWRFWTSANGKSVWVIIAQRNGKKYLKTEADGDEPNNLLSLPRCK